jgi:hypothetical protein
VSRKTWIHLAADLGVVLLLTLLFSLVSRCERAPAAGDSEGVGVRPGVLATPDNHREQTDLPPLKEVFDLKRLRARKVRVEEHQVRIGENYWSIARDYGLNVRTLLGANPDMPFTASVGQTLLVPSQDGVLHPVEKGDTFRTVAELYGADEKALRDANPTPWWSPLRTGDLLFVPDAKPLRMSDQWKDYFSKRGRFGVPFAEWGKGWTSRYGLRTDPITGEQRMHRGMDFKARYGAEVFASAGGRVTFAGVSGGYGNLVILAHGSGYTSYYGHLSRIEVRVGQKVRRGQRIGRVGTSGRVTGPHLHFEIRKNGRTVDPLPLI